MIQISDGKPRKMKSYMKLLNVVFSPAILSMVQEQSTYLLRGPHMVLLVPSVCAGRQGSHCVFLCVPVKGTGCARGLSGLEEAWGWEEDIPVCDNLTS